MLLARQARPAILTDAPATPQAQRTEKRRPKICRFTPQPARDIRRRFRINMLHMKNVDTMHMYAARKIARKTNEKTLNLKGEMYFATETRLDKIEVCCGLQKLVRPMMLQGCCKADRAEVVERDRFATPNSLKSHGERNLLSPVSNTCAITPKLCMPSRPVHPSKNYPALKSRTAAKSP